jgi:pyrimidine-specific ribonucleoside hydrolase
VKEHAVEFLIKLLESTEENSDPPLTIIALAPLTNIAAVIRLRPDLCKRVIERIVWMGGSAFAGGNASQWGEANAEYDPEAAHIVLQSGVEITMYTWDVYLKVEYSRVELEEMGLIEPTAVCRYAPP